MSTAITPASPAAIVPPAPAPAGPLDLAIQAWLHAKSGRTGSAKTARAYADTLTRFRGACRTTGTDLDGDDRALALRAQAWAAAGDPAPATYNQRLAIVSSFYVFAAKRGLLEMPNLIARLERRPVQAYAGAAPLDYAAIKHQLSAIDRSTLAGARDYALLEVGLQTGRRRSEIAGLEGRDVMVAGHCVTLTWRRCKGGKVMRDTLPAPVGAALLAYGRALHGPGLWPPDAPVRVSLARNGSYGQALGLSSIADLVARHLGTSKVHTLRHTYARAMEDAGAKVSDIQARLGHSSLATTGKYLAALRTAENAQGDALAGLLGLDG